MFCIQCKKTKDETNFKMRNTVSGPVRCKTCKDCSKYLSEWRKEWRKKPKGLAWIKRNRESETVQASIKKHRESEYSKQYDVEYWKKDEVKQRRAQKYREDQDGRLLSRIGSKMSTMAKGMRNFSLNVCNVSGFANAADLRAHLQSTTELDIDTMPFHIDHKIPKICYRLTFEDGELLDRSVDGENMQRCWNRKNLAAVTPEFNMGKHTSLPCDEELLQIREIWPSHWNNELPSAEYRSALRTRSLRNFANPRSSVVASEL